MYNFLSQNRGIIRVIISFVVVLTTGLLFYFTPVIFKEPNVFFYTSSTIVQGFVALTAFLGAVVVFKIQLEDQAMQKLSEGIERAVRYYRGVAARTYTSTQMMNVLVEILSDETNVTDRDIMKKTKEKMEETIASRNEIRNAMVDFAVISFFNIAVALVSLLFTPVLVNNWKFGGFILSANVYLSIFSLSKALEVVRRTMGYSFNITLGVRG